MLPPHYPYTFLTRQSTRDVPVPIYHFRSSRTKKWYIVRVEEYPNKFFGIKFYLKDDRLNPHKYNRLTGLNEPRPIINTCIAILMELAEQYPDSSFGFIGANLIGESEKETKRLGLDKPVIVQYFLWAKSFIKGDMGYCIDNTKVSTKIKARIINTLLLSLCVIVCSFI